MKTFQEAIRTRGFTLSAELRLDARSSAATLVDQASRLRSAVDAIQVTDSPAGRVHMSPLVAAGILLKNQIDPVLHISCRDRNRIALRGDLLGAAELGVTSLLMMRGQKLPVEYPGKVKGVFDWGVKKLIANANALQSDPDNPNPPQFFLGSVVTAFKPKRDWEPEKIAANADAGIKFIQTQLCFDIDLVKRYMASLVSAKLLERVSVIVGVAPIPSAEIGEWLASNLRGTVVPDPIMKRLRQSSDPEREGIEICAEMLQQLAEVPGVSGANVASFAEADVIASAIELAGLRS